MRGGDVRRDCGGREREEGSSWTRGEGCQGLQKRRIRQRKKRKEEAAARNAVPPRMPSTAANEPEQGGDRDPQDGSCLGFDSFVSHLHQ